MNRIFFLLIVTLIIVGCARQPKLPIAEKKATSSPESSTPAPSEKITKQTSVRFADFSPDGKLFVVGFRHSEYKVYNSQKLSGSLEIWDVAKRERIAVSQFNAPITNVTFFRKKELLLVDGNLCDSRSGRVVKRLEGCPSAKAFAISPDEKFIAFPIEDRIEVRHISDWKLHKIIGVEPPVAGFIRTMDYSSDGRRLVTGAWDVRDGVRVYDVEAAREIWVVDGDQQGNVAWSPDGRYVAASVTAGVLLLRAENGDLVKKFPSDYGSPVMFSPDGRQLTFNNNGTLVTCDMRSQRVIRKIRIKNLSDYIVSPNASILAWVSKDGSQVQFKQIEY